MRSRISIKNYAAIQFICNVTTVLADPAYFDRIHIRPLKKTGSGSDLGYKIPLT
jgi:hypothetical protein